VRLAERDAHLRLRFFFEQRDLLVVAVALHEIEHRLFVGVAVARPFGQGGVAVRGKRHGLGAAVERERLYLAACRRRGRCAGVGGYE